MKQTPFLRIWTFALGLPGILHAQDVTLTLKDGRHVHTVTSEITAAGVRYDPVFGARPLKRFLQRNIETKLARALISGEIAEGSTVTFHVKNDELIVEHAAVAV